MKVVNENVESKKNILEYLKNISVNSYNKHEEVELDNYIASVVMITTESSTLDKEESKYNIYVLFQNKKDNKIYGEFFPKEFYNNDEAETYYNEMKDKVSTITNDEIHNLILL